MKNTIPETVICWDAEWVPCARTGRRLSKLPPDVFDGTVFDQMWSAAGSTEQNPRPFLKLALSEVVSISAVVRQSSPYGAELSLVSWPENSNAWRNEADIVGKFLESAAEQKAQLVGYNSAGADLPLLVQRALANGCVCPGFGQRPEKPWDGPDYWSRFSDASVDLMQVLSLSAGRGAATPSLHELANACGIPGKLETAGDAVADLWLNGKHDEIIAYNETDACTTYLLWLRYVRMRGLLDVYEARRERNRFRTYLEGLSSQKSHLGKFLTSWDSFSCSSGSYRS